MKFCGRINSPLKVDNSCFLHCDYVILPFYQKLSEPFYLDNLPPITQPLLQNQNFLTLSNKFFSTIFNPPSILQEGWACRTYSVAKNAKIITAICITENVIGLLVFQNSNDLLRLYSSCRPLHQSEVSLPEKCYRQTHGGGAFLRSGAY